MLFRWLCAVYDNLCSLEQSLNYERPKGSEDTDESSSITGESFRKVLSDDSESFTYLSMIKAPPRRHEKHDKSGGQRREMQRSAMHLSAITPHSEEKRSKDKRRSSRDVAIPEVIVTSSNSADKAFHVGKEQNQKYSAKPTYVTTNHSDNIQEVLIPVGSMVPIAVDDGDAESLSTSDSFSSLKRKWMLGLQSKTPTPTPNSVRIAGGAGADSKEKPKSGKPAKGRRKEPDAMPKETPRGSTFSRDAQNVQGRDILNHKSRGKAQIPGRHGGYNSDGATYMPSTSRVTTLVSRSQRNARTPVGRLGGYVSDTTNNSSTIYYRQFQKPIQSPAVRQRSSSSNSANYNYALSGSSENDRLKANIQTPNGRRQSSYSTETSNYTPSGSSDNEYSRRDRYVHSSAVVKNNPSKKSKFGFMRKKKDKRPVKALPNESSTMMNFSSHYGQPSIKAGAMQQPYPYMVQMVRSSYDQQSNPPPVSNVFVTGVAPKNQPSVRHGQVVQKGFFSPGDNQEPPARSKSHREYGII